MRATKADLTRILGHVEDAAKALGYIPDDLHLSVVTGASITPFFSYHPHLHQRSIDLGFLPLFEKGYRTSPTDVYLALSATLQALAYVSRHERTQP